MKLTLERSHLLKALNHIQRVVERRNTVPILSNVLLSAEEQKLTLKATDLDIEVRETVSASIDKGGATTVAVHMLYDIVRKLPDGAEIMMALADESMLGLVSGRSKFSLPVLPQEDFPDPTPGDFTHKFSMEGRDFRNLIERTQFAISTEETRYYLNGIYLHAVKEDNRALLRAVATDGHRLAQSQLDAPKGCEEMPGIIVPRKTVSEVQKWLETQDSELAIEVSQSKIRFTVGSMVLTSKLIDGTFPDYDRVIPKDNDRELVLSKEAFADAVDRVAVIAIERNRAVKMALDKNALTLSASDPEAGQAQEEMPVEYGHDSLEIGFNSRYLLDIAGQLESENIVFMLADAGSPALIHVKEGGGKKKKEKEGGKEEGKEKEGKKGDGGAGKNAQSLYVLMPMRV